MKSKQTDIATFFGGKPKSVSKSTQPKATPDKAGEPTPSSAAPAEQQPGSASKRKPQVAEDAAGTSTAAAAAAQGSKLKRLRKAGDNTNKTSIEETAAAADLQDDMEDDTQPQKDKEEAPASTPPASAGKKRKSPAKPSPQNLKLDKEQAAAVVAAEQAAINDEIEESEEEEAEDSLVSEGESEEESGPSIKTASTAAAGATKKKKKGAAAVKSPVGKAAKVDGVGTLAIKQAAEHDNFDLSKITTWEAGKPVPFSFLADTFEAIAEESKRLVITSSLLNAFRAVIATTPEDLLPMVYLCTNRVAPAHEGVEMGIGDATLIKALAQATGRKEAIIKSEYDTSGDLGVVAAASRATQKTMFAPPPLTIRGVFKAFKDIATASGDKSQDRKRSMIIELLVGAKQNEAGYVMRALQGKLRIGLAEQTVLVALAHAVVLQKEGLKGKSENLANALEQASQVVKAAYSECPSYDQIIPALLNKPLMELPEAVHFTPGVPVKPMLAKPTNGVSEVLDKFQDQPFTVEYKYDGERAQIHILENGSVKVYSRNSEDNTTKYPDIAALFPVQLKPGVKSLVLDAEAVAYDRESNKVLPFQILSTRARKGVTLESIKVQVCVFAFDCLYINGKALLGEPLTARREAMYGALEERTGYLEFATAKTSHDTEELTRFLDESVEAGTEGLIVKTLADTYEPSKRSSHWLKLKKDYMDGVGDTFDLVPIGAWYGKGKRTGVYGSYLLAVYDPENEEYQSITKIGTGFSEELLKQLAESMKECEVPEAKKYYRLPETLTPDVFFDAKAVWEVKAADLSISPAYKAAMGLVDPNKGISIRFPRLVRVRDDKGPEDSTSPDQIADMYQKQAVVAQQQKKKGGAGGDEDW